jgi:predicted O-methyltransferase YrrM
MSERTLQLDDALQAYLHDHALREPGPCRQLRERTRRLERADMISSPEQVQLLALVADLADARRVLEVGTFTGYMPLWLALRLPEARFICIDRDRTATAMKRVASGAPRRTAFS